MILEYWHFENKKIRQSAVHNMESGHFIDASTAGATITTASGTVVVGGTGINPSGGASGVPKVAYQVSRVFPIASAAVTQSQLHPVAGEISSVEDDGDGGTQNSGGTIQAVLTNGLNGQFYVIGNPTDVLGARTIAPRGGVMAGGAERAVSSSSERRRATHNEVERRRRDTIKYDHEVGEIDS